MEFELSVKDPHNIFTSIFAESGIFGLISFCVLMFYILTKSLVIFKKGRPDSIKKPFILSFWILFIYSLFNPSVTFKYQALFFLFLSLIEISTTRRF